MSFAFLALYTGDYLRDTRHLTPLKHGVYLLLLMHCWDQRGPLPLDEQECAGIANCRSADEIESLRYVMNRYFTRMEDGFYNLRIQREIEKSQALSSKRQHAGFKGYEAKYKKIKENQAIAKQVSSKSQALASTTTTTPTITTTPGTPEGQQLAPSIPKAQRSTVFPNDFEVTEVMSKWAIEQGLPVARVMPETEKFRSYHLAKGSKFVRWNQAWANWIRNSIERMGVTK